MSYSIATMPVLTTPIILVPTGPIAKAPTPAAPANNLWFISSSILFILLVAGGIYFRLETEKLKKQVRSEEFRTRELKKRLDLALKSIQKMETNPDLINSREFNLDYLRMRMQEETFHFAIVNQIKMKIKTMVSVALRPTQQQAGVQPPNQQHANQGRQVDQLFDVEYETSSDGIKKVKRVLFRVQVRISKLPTQPTSRTIEEIITCLERYLSLADDDDSRWQPTIQGRIVTISWDQKAKPTPLLVLEQSGEGMNVTLKVRRAAGAAK